MECIENWDSVERTFARLMASCSRQELLQKLKRVLNHGLPFNHIEKAKVHSSHFITSQHVDEMSVTRDARLTLGYIAQRACSVLANKMILLMPFSFF